MTNMFRPDQIVEIVLIIISACLYFYILTRDDNDVKSISTIKHVVLWIIGIRMFITALHFLVPNYDQTEQAKEAIEQEQEEQSYEMIMDRIDPDATFTKELYIDPNTELLYYKDTMTPYYSENGKICRMVEGIVFEIGKDGQIIEGEQAIPETIEDEEGKED